MYVPYTFQQTFGFPFDPLAGPDDTSLSVQPDAAVVTTDGAPSVVTARDAFDPALVPAQFPDTPDHGATDESEDAVALPQHDAQAGRAVTPELPEQDDGLAVTVAPGVEDPAELRLAPIPEAGRATSLSSANVHLVHDAESLKAAFKAAQGGDRIEIAAGAEIDGAVSLRKRSFSDAVTITSADADNPGRILGQLELFQVGNVVIENLEFAFEAVHDDYSAALFLRGISDMVLKDLDMRGYIPGEADGVDPLDPGTGKGDAITGYGHGRALRVANGTDIVIEDVSMRDYRQAARLEDLANVSVTGLHLTALREGLNMFDITGMTIEDSRFIDFKPWWYGDSSVHDHADMIQYWGKHSETGLHDITIRDNVFDQSDGKTQTIFGEMRSAPDGVTATDFHITGNVIVNRQPNAIRLDGVEGATIENNLVLSNGSDPDKFPKIFLLETGGAVVRDNVVAADGVSGMSDAEAAAAGNLLLSKDPSEPLYWGDLLEAWRKGDVIEVGGAPYVDQVTAFFGGSIPKSDIPQADDPGTEDPGTDDPAADDPQIEDPGTDAGALGLTAGTVDFAAGAETWRGVSFGHDIPNASVVVGPLLFDSPGDPATVRVRNVTDTGFEFMVDEWDYLDGNHGDGQVSWIAAPAGIHELESGQRLVAGSTRLGDDTPADVALQGLDAAPAVFAQVATAAGGDTVVTRLSDVSADGFSVGMQEQESNNQTHKDEDLHWIAIASAPNGEVALDTTSVTHRDTALSLTPDDTSVLLAALQTRNGGDPATLAWSDTGSGPALRVEEEQSRDYEMRHISETAAWASLEAGWHDLVPV